MNARVSLLTGVVVLGLFVQQAVAIVGGQEDSENKYSNVGTVVFAPPGSVPNPRFTGILIHPRVFLTCAHTVLQFERNHPWPFTDCYVSFAPDVRCRDQSLESEIEALIAHPDYEPNGYGPHRNDVGVIILKASIDKWVPAVKAAGVKPE